MRNAFKVVYGKSGTKKKTCKHTCNNKKVWNFKTIYLHCQACLHPCCKGIELPGVFLTVSNRDGETRERFLAEKIPEQVNDQHELSEELPLHRRQTASIVRQKIVVKHVGFVSFDSSENENSEISEEISEYLDQ